MGGFYNIVLIIYLYVVHVIICNPRNSASGCNVVSILIIIIIIIMMYYTTKKCLFHCMYDLMSYTLFYINYLLQLYPGTPERCEGKGGRFL